MSLINGRIDFLPSVKDNVCLPCKNRFNDKFVHKFFSDSVSP